MNTQKNSLRGKPNIHLTDQMGAGCGVDEPRVSGASTLRLVTALRHWCKIWFTDSIIRIIVQDTVLREGG